MRPEQRGHDIETSLVAMDDGEEQSTAGSQDVSIGLRSYDGSIDHRLHVDAAIRFTENCEATRSMSAWIAPGGSGDVTSFCEGRFADPGVSEYRVAVRRMSNR